MKLRIDIDNELREEEIIIKCKTVDKTIEKLQKAILDITLKKPKLVFYKNEVEYYLMLEEILFFETVDNTIFAHTKNDVFKVKYRLYELESILPNNFVRISKSTILNINHIYAVTKNITSSSLIEFLGTHKQIYVSRQYYKNFKNILDERRNYEK